MEKTLKINLASGQRYLDGYLNIDDLSMNPGEYVDVEIDVFKFAMKDESVEEIRLHHFMMYIPYNKAHFILKKWYKWLVPGGKIIIETSDALVLAKRMLDDNASQSSTSQMFGYGDTAGHKWAWSRSMLQNELSLAGFKDFIIEDGGSHNRPDRDFTITATK